MQTTTRILNTIEYVSFLIVTEVSRKLGILSKSNRNYEIFLYTINTDIWKLIYHQEKLIKNIIEMIFLFLRKTCLNEYLLLRYILYMVIVTSYSDESRLLTHYIIWDGFRFVSASIAPKISLETSIRLHSYQAWLGWLDLQLSCVSCTFSIHVMIYKSCC